MADCTEDKNERFSGILLHGDKIDLSQTSTPFQYDTLQRQREDERSRILNEHSRQLRDMLQQFKQEANQAFQAQNEILIGSIEELNQRVLKLERIIVFLVTTAQGKVDNTELQQIVNVNQS
ncbi:MAG: hypothetical protein ACREQ5_10520 [Candidatus Dormibacteria bacterium]